MVEIKFEQINIKPLEWYIKRINKFFEDLRWVNSIELQSDLEYEIYYFACASSDIARAYTRNLYKLNKEKDTRFLVERKNYNSDLTTTKKVNKDLIKEHTELELQEQIIDWLEERKKDIHRLANHINNSRIDELANNKRQPK